MRAPGAQLSRDPRGPVADALDLCLHRRERAGGAGELPQRLRDWAAALHEVFHGSYWCEDEQGPFIALALDGQKRPVDGVASNMGHLLGTGLLDAEQERIVVDRLLDPTMFSGYGVRTLSTTNGGYGPLRYHGGSVWTHDTGWILRRMLLAGFDAEAAVLARGLLRAAQGFGRRLPELFSGQEADQVDPPHAVPGLLPPAGVGGRVGRPGRPGAGPPAALSIGLIC